MAKFKSISRLKRALWGKKHSKSDRIIDCGDEEKEMIVSECQNNSPIDIEPSEENRFFANNHGKSTINRPINSLLRSFRRKMDGRKKGHKKVAPYIPAQPRITSPLFTDQSTSGRDEIDGKKSMFNEILLDFTPDNDSEIPYADEGDSEEDESPPPSIHQAQLKHKYHQELLPPKSSPPPPPISSYSQMKESLCHLNSSFSHELAKLAKCGWYWGPISRSEADEKLSESLDGAFLVRDSSDDHHLLSLSFRSNGRTYHTRIEHNNGLFSFTSQPLLPAAYPSVITLINESIKKSRAGVFCYSCGRSPGTQAVPVRLITPISRFNQVRSLKFLCRFVIRQYTRYDHISKLPLPSSVKCYLEQSHYQ